MNRIRVLFLCTANSARSQMAQAFLNKYGEDTFEAFSAGLEPQGIHPMTIRVMEEIGIDMSGHTSKPLSDYMGKIHFSYLVTVCTQADKNCPAVFPGMGRRVHWDIEDPAAFQGPDDEKLDKFREIRDQIEHRIKTWLFEKHINE